MLAKNPLPDFSRAQWVSAKARYVWESRIAAIGKQFEAAERASVGRIRAAALQNISPEQFPAMAQRAAKVGLVATPIGHQGYCDGYAASAIEHKGSGPWEYRVALTMPGSAKRFLEAWQKNDDEAIGRLLGYPPCCCDFFLKTWGAGSVDPTWEMADRGDGPIEANILLRWLGVRYVPHLPCGFRCDATLTIGEKIRAEIPKRERGWMDSLLSMPMLWTSLNGIGEVVTPIVTLNFRSDMGHEILEIHRKGSSYPEAGAHGLRFPYRPAGRADQKTLGPDPVEKRLWTDNGFSSLEAMEEGHKLIRATLYHARGMSGDIIDLGAGNGELIRKLGPDRVFGLESNAGRYSRRVYDGVRLGRIQDAEDIFPNQRFSVAMISIRRFAEMTEKELKELHKWFLRSVDRILIYQYEDPKFARLVVPYDVSLPEVVTS